MGDFVYQNKYFDVTIGKPPLHAVGAEVRNVYIVTNRETGVEEYYHTVLFVAKEWCEHFAKAMDGEIKEAENEMISLGLTNIN